MALGAEYLNKPGTFKNFRPNTCQAKNHGISEEAPDVESEDEDGIDHDIGGNLELTLDDLAMDEEEFPLGTDPSHFVTMTQEVIEELSKVCILIYPASLSLTLCQYNN